MKSPHTEKKSTEIIVRGIACPNKRRNTQIDDDILKHCLRMEAGRNKRSSSKYEATIKRKDQMRRGNRLMESVSEGSLKYYSSDTPFESTDGFRTLSATESKSKETDSSNSSVTFQSPNDVAGFRDPTARKGMRGTRTTLVSTSFHRKAETTESPNRLWRTEKSIPMNECSFHFKARPFPAFLRRAEKRATNNPSICKSSQSRGARAHNGDFNHSPKNWNAKHKQRQWSGCANEERQLMSSGVKYHFLSDLKFYSRAAQWAEKNNPH